MTVSLTNEQAKNWAATHRSMANVLDPPVSTPTPTPDGGSVIVSPTGFPGGVASVDPTRWNETPAFQENFPNLANKGEFLGKYSKWSANRRTTS
jgi:hypothetical protein